MRPSLWACRRAPYGANLGREAELAKLVIRVVGRLIRLGLRTERRVRPSKGPAAHPLLEDSACNVQQATSRARRATCTGMRAKLRAPETGRSSFNISSNTPRANRRRATPCSVAAAANHRAVPVHRHARVKLQSEAHARAIRDASLDDTRLKRRHDKARS